MKSAKKNMRDSRRFSLSSIEKAFNGYLAETFIERTYWADADRIYREHWKRFVRLLSKKKVKK